MSKLADEIETLRKEAAERAITTFYNAVENLSMFDVPVFDVVQMFANRAWQMRDVKPFRAGPVPAAEQEAHLQRLKDVVQGNAEQSLIEAAGTLWDSGLQGSDILRRLDEAFGPDFYGDDEQDELDKLHPVLVKARAEYGAGTLAPEKRATIESIFGQGFFTGFHREDEEDESDQDAGHEGVMVADGGAGTGQQHE